MAEFSSEIILHNYPQSPVAEKVRVALGIKALNWCSVEIPRIPPKPLLTKLTGGYRRTPVMQIGADIYCDSLCILGELEERYPLPSFFPTSDAGLIWCLSRWTDGDFFELAVKIVLGSNHDNLPPDFAQDRGQLYLGPDWAKGLKTAHTSLLHLVAQLRVQLVWLDRQLADGRKFLLGESPAAIDAQIYCLIWFLRGRWDQGSAFLSEFQSLIRWEENVKYIGHGVMSDLTAEEAISRASASSPVAKDSVFDPNDPQGLKPGLKVIISPDVDSGEQPVEGAIASVSAERISLLRKYPDLGEVCVHFPRSGYVVHHA